MTQTLSSIQTLARWEARDAALDLTTTQGLAIANKAYRRLANLLDFPELIRTDTSLSTTADTESYTWPSTNVYIDVTAIEIQHPAYDLQYKLIAPARTESEFSILRERKSSFPLIYRRQHNGTNNVLSLAPKPDTSSLTIRITGKIEPTALSGSGSTTVFLQNSADEALALLISADIADKRNDFDRARNLIAKASEILTSLAGREITVAEVKYGK